MKYINSLIAMLAVMFALGTVPAMAQTADEPITTDEPVITDDETTDDEEESDGNFSRNIPEGLKKNLTEEEITDYQAQLDAATTPQERNEVRREIQRTSIAARHEGIKQRQEEKTGFFGGLMNKLAEGAKARKKSDAREAKERKDSGLSDRSSGGGKSGGKSGGKGGGNGGGNGKGKSK